MPRSRYRTSTEQVPNKLREVSPSVSTLVKAIGDKELKIVEMMEALGLKHRPTFLYNYLIPAVEARLVTMLYPNSPRHPRQRYHLTPKAPSSRTREATIDTYFLCYANRLRSRVVPLPAKIHICSTQIIINHNNRRQDGQRRTKSI